MFVVNSCECEIVLITPASLLVFVALSHLHWWVTLLSGQAIIDGTMKFIVTNVPCMLAFVRLSTSGA